MNFLSPPMVYVCVCVNTLMCMDYSYTVQSGNCNCTFLMYVSYFDMYMYM